jgi:hypothetical protein
LLIAAEVSWVCLTTAAGQHSQLASIHRFMPQASSSVLVTCWKYDRARNDDSYPWQMLVAGNYLK